MTAAEAKFIAHREKHGQQVAAILDVVYARINGAALKGKCRLVEPLERHTDAPLEVQSAVYEVLLANGYQKRYVPDVGVVITW